MRLCSPRWPGQRRSAGCCEEAGRAAGNRQAQLAPGHPLASLLALNGLPVAGPGRKIMPDITPQLLTLLGVAVGAAASYLAGAATERTRWRREQSSRWDEKRAQAYSEYGYAVKNVYVQCLRIANSRLQNSAGDPAGHAEALAQLGALTDERTAKWETVLLLGSPQAITAARIWHRRVWQVELFARGIRTDVDEYDTVLQEVIADRTRFYEADVASYGEQLSPCVPVQNIQRRQTRGSLRGGHPHERADGAPGPR
jgi:hypothetical protein